MQFNNPLTRFDTAVKILAGIAANPKFEDESCEDAADMAIRRADALINRFDISFNHNATASEIPSHDHPVNPPYYLPTPQFIEWMRANKRL